MADRIAPAELRERCERRLKGMQANRRSVESDWKEVAAYFPPRRGRWLCASPDQGERLNSKLLNGTGAKAASILANGMASGLSSPSRPWFRLGTEDPQLREYGPVKDFLGLAQNALYQLLARTNFYNAAQGGYKELGLFGIEAAIFTPHWKHRGVVHQLTAGEYWVGMSDALQPDSLYRRCPLTVGQLVQKFGSGASRRVREMYDRGDLDEWIACFHAIEPNPDRVPGKADRANLVYRSVYWEEGSDRDEVLEVAGFDQQPFWAPRWEVVGSTTYGSSPAMDALGDAKQLQLKELRLQQAIDYVNRPPLKGPPSLETAVVRNVPGGVTFMAPADDAAFKPIYEIRPDLSALQMDIGRVEAAIGRHFFVDLFMAITQMEGIQPRNEAEVAERVGEKMTQLGPVVERVQNEKLRIAVEIGWSIVLKMGVLPPPPPEIAGREMKLEFISMLAQMQRAAGLTAIERTAGFIGGISGAFPGALDKFDADQAVDEYADIMGAPPAIIRSDDEVEKIRAERAQAEMAAQMAAAAGPALQGAQAAKTLSETDAGGESALQRLLGAG